MYIVFDTNVYISAFGVPGSKASSAYGLAEEGVFDLVVSSQILEEIRLKLGGPKFGFSDARVNQVEELIRELATVIEPDRLRLPRMSGRFPLTPPLPPPV